jgi:hypothetical protein
VANGQQQGYSYPGGNTPQNRKQQEFIYSTGRITNAGGVGGALAPGAVFNAFINIQADADFVIEKQTYAADIAGAALTFNTWIMPNVLILLTSTGSGQQLMSAPVPIPSAFGHGMLPAILPYPYVLPANSQLQITLTSFEAVSQLFLTLNFIGRKLYLIGSQV